MGRRATSGRVEIRPNSLRLAFQWQGQTCRETLRLNGAPMRPTKANVLFATRLSETIQNEIRLGTFDYGKHFPDSPRAPAALPNTFGALADLWLTSKGQLEDATRDQYGNAAGVWKKILGAGTPVADLTYQVLAAKIGGRKWSSAKSANNYLIVLRGILGFEYSGARAAANPMVGIKNLKVKKTPPDPLTPDERDMILEDMRQRYDPRVWAYFVWQFYTGMRPEEAIAIRWESIDWNAGTARVERVRTFKGSERDGAKTEGSVRDVDLVPPAMEALATMKRYTFLKDGDIFEHPVYAKPWHDERSQRDTYWKPCLKRLGIRARRAYCTRHTYATVALMAGVNPAYVAKQMGHTDTQMFFSTYTKWLDGADKGVQRAAMERAMGNISPGSPQPAAPARNTLISLPNSGRRDWTRSKRAGGEG